VERSHRDKATYNANRLVSSSPLPGSLPGVGSQMSSTYSKTGAVRRSPSVWDDLRQIDRIGRQVISPGAAALLALIQRRQRSGKWHFASGDALAAALKVSRRSVLRYTAELERAGLLAVWRRVGLHKTEAGAIERRKIASGYRVMSEAVRKAAQIGSAVRGQTVKLAKQAQAVAATLARFCTRSLSCDNLSRHTGQDVKKEAEKGRLLALIASRTLSEADEAAAWVRLADLEGH
jgi:DNA-binding transcriptional regulator YhcF (GntR family)